MWSGDGMEPDSHVSRDFNVFSRAMEGVNDVIFDYMDICICIYIYIYM